MTKKFKTWEKEIKDEKQIEANKKYFAKETSEKTKQRLQKALDYYYKNKDKQKQKNKEWQEKNKEKRRLYQQERYIKDREKRKLYQREYKKRQKLKKD